MLVVAISPPGASPPLRCSSHLLVLSRLHYLPPYRLTASSIFFVFLLVLMRMYHSPPCRIFTVLVHLLFLQLLRLLLYRLATYSLYHSSPFSWCCHCAAWCVSSFSCSPSGRLRCAIYSLLLPSSLLCCFLLSHSFSYNMSFHSTFLPCSPACSSACPPRSSLSPNITLCVPVAPSHPFPRSSLTSSITLASSLITDPACSSLLSFNRSRVAKRCCADRLSSNSTFLPLDPVQIFSYSLTNYFRHFSFWSSNWNYLDVDLRWSPKSNVSSGLLHQLTSLPPDTQQ